MYRKPHAEMLWLNEVHAFPDMKVIVPKNLAIFTSGVQDIYVCPVSESKAIHLHILWQKAGGKAKMVCSFLN